MDVVLAVLPFADVDRPAIGVSLLKAEAERRSFRVSVEYLNIGLAERIGLDTYALLSESLPTETLVGEWFFADLLFGEDIPDEEAYYARILGRFTDPVAIAAIRAARPARAAFVDEAAERILLHRPDIVGFTTTFHQTCACLSVAKRLKTGDDVPLIIFGGGNCEGEMGQQMLQSFPWIDYVCTREGDEAFPEFLDWVRRGQTTKPPPGILGRSDMSEVTLPAIVSDMDSLPIPDYADYFLQLEGSPLRDQVKCELLVETARGCWWGARHHCSFCGLNGDTMGFRSKSPERVLSEFATLSETYGISKLNCVDNILGMKYVDTVFPALAAQASTVELFFEIKANLKLSQLRVLKAGGVRSVQPGIESFSDAVLSLMNKGCRGAQNVQLLRWCDEVGITPLWNLLAGFPGEDPNDYERMADLVPSLIHLPPPSSCSPIRLDRFSPLFVNPSQAGLKRVRPTAAYYYVFPLGRRELSRLAYFFEFDYEDGRKPEKYTERLNNEVGLWLRAHGDGKARPRLDAIWVAEDYVEIEDTRPIAVHESHKLRGLEARVLLECDTGRTLDALRGALADVRHERLMATLDTLTGKHLLAELGGRYVCLPVFRERYSHPTRGHAYVETWVAQATLA